MGTEQFRGPMQWYEDEFGWNAPLKFNAFFSIATSLAFALVCLALAAFRLRVRPWAAGEADDTDRALAADMAARWPAG